jgi:transcriptional regulator with XRE-family HTH domain
MTTDPDAVFLRALGKRIRIARLTHELTQAELADATGISRSFISLLEHGGHGVDVVRLLRIAAALDLPLADLVNTGGDQR